MNGRLEIIVSRRVEDLMRWIESGEELIVVAVDRKVATLEYNSERPYGSLANLTAQQLTKNDLVWWWIWW
jgi:hypothetical protein